MIMKIGLIDVDGHNYPNLPLMKISAWHKQKGDLVEWYEPLVGMIDEYDKVYMSKVFSFTPDYQDPIYAKEIEKGGSGYCISLIDGQEQYDKSKDKSLPYEIEHIMPDYSLYPQYTENRAMGFLTRGCPRGCFFCHVKDKEGRGSYKVADLSEFWNGQKYIELMDPNLLACQHHEELLQQLIDSKSIVEFNQGLDIRLMTDRVIEMMNQIKLKSPHFAWDRYQDKEIIVPKFKEVSEKLKYPARNISVYCLTNYDSSLEQDIERVMTLRSMGYSPYIMRYDKEHIPRGHILNKLARWCNNRIFFWKYETFDDYLQNETKESNT